MYNLLSLIKYVQERIILQQEAHVDFLDLAT